MSSIYTKTTTTQFTDFKSTSINTIPIFTNKNELFLIKSANEWLEIASRQKVPRKLFGNFWSEGEVSILFAGTGLGKSILSVQIADSISSGKPILGLEMELEKAPVLYFDLEISDLQFRIRNTNYIGDVYSFDPNFHRVTFDSDYEKLEDQNNYNLIFKNIEAIVTETGVKILVIDNLTYLNNDVEKAKDASTLVKNLKALSKKHGLSILVVGHTPKRDESKPLDLNDLSGSKMISNLVDSVFAIGSSQKDSNYRYIKQLKCRSAEMLYTSENVIVCQIDKYPSKLEMKFVEFGYEQDHLKEIDKLSRMNEAKRLKTEGKSNVEIGKLFGVTEGAVRAWLKE